MRVSLIDGWRKELRRLWTIRLAVFWGAVHGLLAVWPALADVVSPGTLAIGGVVMSASLVAARLLKQAEPE